MLPSAKRQRTDKGPASISPSTYRPDFNPDDAKTPGFFSDVLKEFGVETANPNIAIITVNHVVSTLPHYLGALENIGRIAGVIQKSSYEDPRVKEYVNAQGYFFLDWTKEQILENPKGFVEYLKTIIKEEEKLVIVDIGGYFAPCVEAFANDPWCREHIIGIVEDTQNGHDKYKKVVDKSHVPIISVAQSELKKTEDYNVGKSIVEAADTILRDTAATITERMKICVVIGFGKIGRSIAEHLRKKGIQEIIVLEINDALLMEAASLGFKICRAADQDQALKKADMIFSATGKQALKDNIFAELKDKAFVASVTSSEDEMSLTWLKEHAEIIPHKNIVEYKINGKSIYLLSDGNAVNFTYGGINGPYICSVQAELLIAAHKLIKKEEYVVKPELQELSSGDMQTIAGIWLDTYETQRLNIPNEVTFQFQNENLFLIPEYSPHFIGRESLLEKIGLCYQSNNRASFKPLVLIGLGGLGKSELALKYAWNNRVQYTNCFYLSGDTLEADLEKMATELGLLQNEEKVSIEQIYDQLKLLGKTLLIFDDVESYNKIEKYLPPKKKGFSQSNFNILMTTRNQNGWSECETIVINPDDQVLKDDAVRYIQKELTYEERNTAIQLAKALQYHPLALSQAVAFIRNNPDCDISTYLRLLEEKTREMLSFPRQEPHEDQNKCMVSTTWNISLQALDLETRNIIQMSAFLFPDSIQNNLFASIINPNAYLLNLLQYSLIHRTDQYSFKIHRLLQEVIRDQLNREEKVQQLSRLIPFLSAQTAYRRIDLDPVVAAAHHLESFRAYMKKPGVNILDSEIAAQEYPRFLYQVALYYLDHLYHNEYAFEILTHARNLVGVVVSEDLTIRIQRQYAKACVRLKKFEEADLIYSELLNNENIEYALRLKIKIDRHILYKSSGKLSDAEEQLKEVLNDSNDDTELKAMCYHYLGSLLQAKLNGKRNLIEVIEREIDALPEWQDINAKYKREAVDKLISDSKSIVKEIIDNYKKSLELKSDSKNYLELTRTILVFVKFINKNVNVNMQKAAVENIKLLFTEVLQYLDVKFYKNLFYEAAVALAKIYSECATVFQEIGFKEQAYRILKVELRRIEKEYGRDHEKSKRLRSFISSTQSAITDFFNRTTTQSPDPLLPRAAASEPMVLD